MSGEHRTRRTQATGAGYCLIPWAELFRRGEMVEWPDAPLAVLPILAAHANRKGEAYPGYNLICALGSVSKTTVVEGLDFLISNEWIAKTYEGQGGGYNRYRLLYGEHDSTPRENMAIHHKLIFSGTWGAMPPSVRRAYVLLRSFAWAGLGAIDSGYEIAQYGPLAETYDEEETFVVVNIRDSWRQLHFTQFQFLPEHIYDPAQFVEFSGLPQRTFRYALAWLIEHGLVNPYVNDEGAVGKDRIAGFIIPYLSRLRFPHVRKAVEKAKQESAARRKGSAGGKRGFAARLRQTALERTTPSAW